MKKILISSTLSIAAVMIIGCQNNSIQNIKNPNSNQVIKQNGKSHLKKMESLCHGKKGKSKVLSIPTNFLI